MPGYGVGLWTLLTVDDVEFDLVSFFQRLVSIYLNGRVMYENIRSVFTTDEAEAFGVIEPLDCAFVLSHRISSFLFSMLATFFGAAKWYDVATRRKVEGTMYAIFI